MSAFKKKARQEVKKGVTTVTRYARQLFSVSGVNGVSHIALAKTPGRRTFWVCLFAFSVVGWFYQTSALLEYYYEYRTVVKIEVSKVHEMPFPGMTICNANKIRRSEFCKARPERCNSSRSITLSRREIFNLTLEYLIEDKKAALGHQLQDMIISCTFTGSPELDTKQCLEYFQPLYQPNFGNCFVFSSGDGKREKLTVTEVDAWHDLKAMTLVLNVEFDDYLDKLIEAPGIVLTFHEDMDYPEISTHGIHVHPDTSHNIALEKVSVHLLPKPYRTNCTEYHDLPFHTLSELELSPMICSVECLMHEQHKKCGHGYVTDNVVLFGDHMPYDPRTITEEDKRCADEVSASVENYCSTLCDTPCHDIYYTVTNDFTPSDHKLKLDQAAIDEYRKRINNTEKRIYASILHIHFQTLEHRIFKHYPEFNTETLFSYLGGITGGWLGISLLEFCAFLEGLCSVLLFSARYCKPARRATPRSRKGRRSPRKTPQDWAPEVYQHRGQCPCQCRPDYGTLLLGMPVATSNRTVQIVPLQYY